MPFIKIPINNCVRITEIPLAVINVSLFNFRDMVHKSVLFNKK